MSITPTTAQLSILELNVAMFGQAVGTTAMAAALPTFVDGNTYAQQLYTTSDAYKILSPEQAFTKVINNLSAGTGVTDADVAALAKGLLPFLDAGLTVGATINLLTAYLYNNAGKLTGGNAIWNNASLQLFNKTAAASVYTLDQNNAAASTSAIANVFYTNGNAPTGNYAGTANDDIVQLLGGLASTIKIEGGEQGANGDTLVITASASATANVINLTQFSDQNRTVDTQAIKVSPIIQGFENIDATAATTEMNLTGRDRTSEGNTGGVAAAQTGSILLGGAYRDTIAGGTGSDSISGNAGNDSITAGAGNDTISGGDNDDSINAGAGNDIITDGTGNDSVSGGDGNDTITIGGGTDLINGDGGNDTISFVKDAVEGTSATAPTSVYGGAGNDTINNTNATAGSFLLEAGNSGNDIITVGLASETITGGADNDIFVIAKANLSAADVFNGNDGQDAMQLLIPNGDATTTYELTPVNGQFKGFEVIELIDQSGNTAAKTYKINLTDDFIANNMIAGQLLIDARGLPAGSNLVIDTSALTNLSSTAFTTGKFQIWTSPSTDVRDQLNKGIDSNYLINASNAALNGVAAFYTNASDTTNKAGVHDATTGLITTTPAGATAYTLVGGTAETGVSSASGNTFTLNSTTSVITAGANSGTTDSATSPTKGMTTSQDIINALLFINAGSTNYIQDNTTGDSDILNAIISTGTNGAPASPIIQNVETLNINGAGGFLNLGNITGATAINLVGGNLTVQGVAATSPITVNNGYNGTVTMVSSTATGTAASFATTLAGASSTAVVQYNKNNAAMATLQAGDTVTETVTANTTLARLADDTAAVAGVANLVVKGSGNLTVADAQFLNMAADGSYTGALNLTVKAASAANNSITGGVGADTFDMTTTYAGGVGGDTITGGAGNDTLKVTGTAAIVLTNVGSIENVVVTGATATRVTTAAANLALGETMNITGSTMTNTLNTDGALSAAYKLNITGSSTMVNNLAAGTQNDTITGGAAADVLIGRAGADTLTGGAGVDKFTFGAVAEITSATGANVDRITDFVAGTDKIAIDVAGNLQAAADGAAATALTGAGAVLAGVTFTAATAAMAAMNAAITDTTSVASITDVYTRLAVDLANGAGTEFAASAAAGTATVARVVTFTTGAAAGSYLVMNDSTAAFQAANDLVINVTGVTGVITAADFAFA